MRRSYVSNDHCDVTIIVSDGTVAVNKLMVILLFPDVLHVHDNDLESVIAPDYTLNQIKVNIKSLLYVPDIICDVDSFDYNNNNSVDVAADNEIPSDEPEDLVSSLTRFTRFFEDDTKFEDDIVNIMMKLAQLEVTVPALLETGACKVIQRLQ